MQNKKDTTATPKRPYKKPELIELLIDRDTHGKDTTTPVEFGIEFGLS